MQLRAGAQRGEPSGSVSPCSPEGRGNRHGRQRPRCREGCWGLYSHVKEALDFESLNKSRQGTQYTVLAPFSLLAYPQLEPEHPDSRPKSLPHPSDQDTSVPSSVKWA